MDKFDLSDIMGKAKEMQDVFNKKRSEAGEKTVDVEVAAGMVKATMNGNLELLSLKVDPEIVDQNDVETLEELIRSAVNEGIRKAKELGTAGMADMLSGVDISSFLGGKK